MENPTAKNILRGKNLVLRSPEPADIDFIQKMENDPGIWHFGNTLVPYSRHQIEQYVLSAQHDIYTEKQVRLMIETVSTGIERKTIGAIDLFDFDPFHHRAGVGILVIEKEQGKGYGAEALELLIEYGFVALNLHQLFCNISADNPVSIHLFENAGFQRCGIKKEWRLHATGWTDEIIYQLIKK